MYTEWRMILRSPSACIDTCILIMCWLTAQIFIFDLDSLFG